MSGASYGEPAGDPRRPLSAREAVRSEIIEAAALAIGERGYHGMSMRELARATGKALSSFYNYFESKEDVLYAIQARVFEALIAGARAAVAGAADPADRLHAFILNHVRYFAANPGPTRVVIREAAALPAAKRRRIRTLKERYFAAGRERVQEVLTAHDAGAPAAEVERITYAVFGMLNWMWGWYDPKRHGCEEDVARTIHRTALCGMIGPERDREGGQR